MIKTCVQNFVKKNRLKKARSGGLLEAICLLEKFRIASLRFQSAIFQSSESHSFIRTPEIVLECAETPPRWMSGIIA